MNSDDAAVHAIGCLSADEARSADERAGRDADFARILDGHRSTVARFDILVAAGGPLPRPGVWDRILQSLD